MRIITHVAFGLFFGFVLYYMNIFTSLELILLSGFAAYLPDIDWLTRYLGISQHRTYGHNIWFMIILSLAGWFLTGSFLVLIAIFFGILSHLLSDSLTVTGIWWTYPHGYVKHVHEDKISHTNCKYHIMGKMNMSDYKKESHQEKIIRSLLFGLGGFLFLLKERSFDFFSSEGLQIIIFLTAMGFIAAKILDKLLTKFIKGVEAPIKGLKKFEK